MRKEYLKIEQIPAVLWGPSAEKLVIAIHGNMSNKTDRSIELFARHAIQNGYQVLSFDLPEHGDRKDEDTLCKIDICVSELNLIMEYARAYSKRISLFAISMGVYFSLSAYQDMALEKAWFLSPIIDMQRMIENMMSWFNITPEQLKQEESIVTPIGATLYWDYYCYVKTYPIVKWNVSTEILYGSQDDICEKDCLLSFVHKYACNLEIKDAEHYFHTPDQLNILNTWLVKTIQ
ncbi:alpha/beta hydrolase [Pragia fontium]|uniref:Alpha/beta hydrolase n=1 Tax=Pragia fontium DSM 5563 = ATCC 49100 TaxID=1122977 RepID=A0AAJ5BH71_9GAMM|nr:alpha/beta hydrolase [Pragia fontium]SFC81278.1 hypothetical protein SAMN02745723_104198 [Pragia fontium DSM 5563 = ATCC 49100]VEJ55537.1 Alpha/beta hydrolase family [Pragia fontium]